MLDELFTELKRFEENSKLYEPHDRLSLLNVFNGKIRTLLGRSCVSPQLPPEMNRVVRHARHYLYSFKSLFKSPDADIALITAARKKKVSRQQMEREGLSLIQQRKEKEKAARFKKMQALRERRNTIGEPERLRIQLEMMLETRRKFAKMVQVTREGYEMKRRRRSFDYAEEVDDHKGRLRAIGYEFERLPKMPTVAEVMQDAILIERGLLRSGYLAEDQQAYVGIPLVGGEKDIVHDGPFDGAWRSVDDNIVGFVSTFRPKPKFDGDHPLTEEEKALMAAALANEAAREAARRERPEIWQEHFTEEGNSYFYNVDGDYSAWELPSDNASKIQLQVQCEDEDGTLYWLNETTGEITPILLLEN